MPDWLFEGNLFVYIVLLLLEGLALLLWYQRRSRQDLLAAGIVVGLLALYFLLDRLVETDREQMERKMNEIVAGLNKRDMEPVMRHISEKFKFRDYNRDAMRKKVQDAIADHNIRNIRIWDLEVKEASRDKKTAKVNFFVKADSDWGTPEPSLLCRTVWVLDPDGQWRLQTFDLYNPVVDTDVPLSYPF